MNPSQTQSKRREHVERDPATMPKILTFTHHLNLTEDARNLEAKGFKPGGGACDRSTTGRGIGGRFEPAK
jgi:hypothetical protein